MSEKELHPAASYPRVEVLWDDCSVALPWMTPSDAKEIAKQITQCRSVGYLLEETDEHLVMMGTLGWREDAEMVHTTTIIPRGQINRIVKLYSEEMCHAPGPERWYEPGFCILEAGHAGPHKNPDERRFWTVEEGQRG